MMDKLKEVINILEEEKRRASSDATALSLQGDTFLEEFQLGVSEGVSMAIQELEESFPDITTDIDNRQGVPVVPEFIGDWIEEVKENGSEFIPEINELFDSQTSQNMRKEHKILDWIISNWEDFFRAATDGYLVIREPKYYIILPEVSKEGRDVYLKRNVWDIEYGDLRVDWSLKEYILNNKELYQFTLEEIKAIDPIYCEFLKPVEEVEEDDNK